CANCSDVCGDKYFWAYAPEGSIDTMAFAQRDLKGRTAVVVGGTSGIGLTLAKGLAEAGANVVPTGRREELVQSAAKEVGSFGVRSLAVPCDVSDRKTLESLKSAVLAEFGAVDILVN